MYVKTLDRLVEKVTETREINFYVAFDGTKFTRYRDCVDYERDMVFKALGEKVDELPELEGVVPLTCDINNITGNEFHWYHLKTPISISLCNEILQLYGEEITRTGVIAVEKTMRKDIRVHYYDDCVRIAKEFFRRFDFDLKFEVSDN